MFSNFIITRKGEFVNVIEYRDSRNAKLPFELTVKLREAKKARIISERDKFGRIISAEVPKCLDNLTVDICR